jgi:hypothetical protein
MNHNSKDDQARDLARRALDWLESPQGRRSLQESDDRVAKTTALIEKGREIAPSKLLEPFTV